ncbi:MAG: HNH endonuclease [Steroidobacteraceae bacterium]
MVCACGCGRSLHLGFHVDHVVPLARGGTNWPANLALLAPVCNRKKGCGPAHPRRSPYHAISD